MTNEIPEIKIGTTMSELKSLAENTAGLKETAKDSIFNFIKDEEEFGDGVISNNVELSMIKSYLADLKVDNRAWWEKLFGIETNEPKTVPQVRMPDNLQADGYNDNISVNEYNSEGKGVFDKNTEEFISYSYGQPLNENEEERIIQKKNKTVSITEKVNPRTREEDNDKTHTETVSLENGESVESTTMRTYSSVRDGNDAHVQDSLLDWENDGIADQRNLRIDTGNDGISPVEYRDIDLDGQADVKTVYTKEGEVYYERNKDGKWVIKEA